jgi:hypothetical protein
MLSPHGLLRLEMLCAVILGDVPHQEPSAVTSVVGSLLSTAGPSNR